jgi:hypothetical protein
MGIATLAVAALAALFTAIAAFAAWRAASTATREARVRSQPYVAMGIPRQDYEKDALVIPVKNLGLGPARVVTLQVKDLDGNVVSARVDPGLAPMESSDRVLFALFWPKLDPPTWAEVQIEGSCEDANGEQHPIYAFGGIALPMPSYEGSGVSDVGSEKLLEDSAIHNRAFHLKQVGRAARDGTPLDAVNEWRKFWIISERQGHAGDEYVEWSRGQWAKLGLPRDSFMEPQLVDQVISALNEAATE